MWEIIKKELGDFLYNPRYLVSFAVAAILIFLSVFTGYANYRAEMDNADAAEAMSLQEAKKSETYQFISLDLNRRPELLSIFDFGLNSVIGREGQVETNSSQPASVTDSRSEESPVYALFKELDLTRTVAFVLTLIAILFAHSLVSGEKERGTLKLLNSYSISRSSIILGKLLGAFIPLALLFLIPSIISILGLMVLADISFTGAQVIALVIIVLANLLCLLVFFSMGMAASSLTRSSFMSLLVCLIFWVLSVAVFPRAMTQLAQTTNPSMPIFERDDQLRDMRKNMRKQWSLNVVEKVNSANLTRKEWGESFQDILNSARRETNKQELDASRLIYKEYLRKRKKLLEAIENYTRISPVSGMQHIVHRFTGSGPNQLARFENDLDRYVKELNSYSEEQYKIHHDEEKNKSNGSVGLQLTLNDKGFLEIANITGYDQSTIDLSTMPRFKPTAPTWQSAVSGSIADMLVLIAYSIIFILISVVAFLRYDVR